MDTEQLIDLLSNEKIIIYGTGHVALKFYRALKKLDIDKNIVCFAVTSFVEEDKTLKGIPVKPIETLKLQEEEVICIAVHEAVKAEIIETIYRLKINVRYIWIYPYLYELLLGKPIYKDVTIKLNKVLGTCMEDYRMAIRYAAIDHFLGKNEAGFSMYKKAQALHSSEKTAEERLVKFCELIKNWQSGGYDWKSKIFINTQYEIIDGNHRVALASYYKEKTILADVFSADVDIVDIHGKNAMLTKKTLLAAGFSPEEIKSLDDINKAIRENK